MIKESGKMKEAKLLIFDADDTLWESALYFRRAEEDFVALMQSLGFDPEEIREEVQVKDSERLIHTGYGARPYIDTLRRILESKVNPTTPYMHAQLDIILNLLLNHPLILQPGVIKTLNTLTKLSKQMIVYTMGEKEHQSDKYIRSGITHHFADCVVVPLKTTDSMLELLNRFSVHPDEACMIGNSPKSDINPATACGVNAIYFRRSNGWQAEQTNLLHPQLIETVSNFKEILPYLQ